MPHVTAPARLFRRHTARRPRLSALDIVSLQVIGGFLGPLPVIQLGHWLFGWDSVAVMFGGQ
jgi:hypothetical protein